jgi:large subunit ribosomal protein L9
MAKTEVILTHNIVGLGAESDHVKVAAGYARNYLYPQGLAIPVSAANKRRLEVLHQRRAEREAHELNSMTDIAKSLAKLVLVLKVKTGDDGKMFGAVTAGTIADELKHQFEVTLDKRKIRLDQPLHSLGEHDVELRLHADVNGTLKIRIESTTPPPALEVAAPEAKTADGPRGKGAGREEGRRERPGRRPAREKTA